MARKTEIYLITPPTIANLKAFGEPLDAVLSAVPVAALQIRLKGLSDYEIADAARALGVASTAWL